jgi:hypothetical protein
MKKILVATVLSFGLAFSAGSALADTAPKETRKVCVDVKDKAGKPVVDAKTKKTKQNCKDVKVHKKLEGTKIPEKKK